MPALSELPPPPAGRAGWPWSDAGPATPSAAEGPAWPRVSIVTPSFNQAPFIEETLR